MILFGSFCSLSQIFPDVYNLFYNGSHVVILIFGQATSEDDVLLLGCHLPVLVGQCVVALVVYGIIWLHALLVFRTILLADYGLRTVIDLLTEHFEMLVLNNTGVGFVVTGVVDHGISLIVRHVFHASLEGDGSPVEFAELIIKIIIDGTSTP